VLNIATELLKNPVQGGFIGCAKSGCNGIEQFCTIGATRRNCLRYNNLRTRQLERPCLRIQLRLLAALFDGCGFRYRLESSIF